MGELTPLVPHKRCTNEFGHGGHYWRDSEDAEYCWCTGVDNVIPLPREEPIQSLYDWAAKQEPKKRWWAHPLHHAKYMALTLVVNIILFPPEHWFWERLIGIHL